MIKKNIVMAVLCTFCITAVLFTIIPVNSTGTYNPWADVNNDGKINVLDLIKVAISLGASGTPLTKALVQYDSGWLNITDKQGQYFTVAHNLNITDWSSQNITVDIMGKRTPTSPIVRFGTGVTGFNKTYGGPDNDAAGAVVQTSDGEYVMAGSGFANLVKTDIYGNILWTKSYSGLYNVHSLVKTSDGGYALVGSIAFGPEDFFGCLVKTDALGNMQWNGTYAGFYSVSSLAQTNDGGYAIAGGIVRNGGDAYFVKTDSLGVMQWNRTYGGQFSDYANSIAQSSDGGYAIACSSGSMWLVKTDESGITQWTRTYGGSGDSGSSSIIQTVDGGYAIAGSTDSFGAGESDCYLVKTDSSGNMQWNRTYGARAVARSLVQTSDGGYALTGYANPSGTTYWAACLVKTDASGYLQWDQTFGGTSLDMMVSLVQTSDGGYAMAGSRSVLSSQPPYHFVGDFWLIKVDPSRLCVSCAALGVNTMTLYRDSHDTDWNYIRIRISEIET